MGMSFDRVADRYDATRAYPRGVIETIVSCLEQVLDQNGPTLDLGVGTGRFALPLQERGLEVIGIDISRKMIGKAMDKGVRNLMMGDVRSLPFEDKTFGSTLSIHVLHLVADWRAVLSEVRRVTRGDMISIAFNKEDSEAEEFRRFYEDACGQLGHEVRHPGMRERDLPGVLTPDEERDIAFCDYLVDVSNMLGNYDAKLFSSQWGVPDEVHGKAIDALRARYDRVDDILAKERVTLVRWKADRLP